MKRYKDISHFVSTNIGYEMKNSHTLCEMQTALRNADHLFHSGNYTDSAECYTKAIALSSSLPHDTAFDRSRFEASCQAGLSAVFGRLDRPLESFAAANKALLFYEACGERHPADTGRWLMAIVNQGTALAAFRCFNDAQAAFLRAKELFLNKGLDTPQNKTWLATVEANLAVINAHLTKEP
jgi:tetratricopeptide (TPR) repeat protein